MKLPIMKPRNKKIIILAPLFLLLASSYALYYSSGSIDGTAKIWRRDDGRIIQDLKHPMGAVLAGEE